MGELEYESKYSLIEDIQSIAKSVRNEGKVLLVEPPRCYACGYEFEIHEGKMKIPSKCPECKEQRISWPRIKLAPK